MNWQNVTIDNIATIKGGKRLPKGHDFSSTESTHLYIRARDIGCGKINITEPVFIGENTFRYISRYTVSEDDIVVTIVGANIGDVGFISIEHSGANLTENAAKITVNKKICNSKFLKFILANTYTKKRFQYIASGAAQGKLGLFKIKTFDIQLPPLPIQIRIADILSAYDDLIENNRRRIQLLEESARLLYQEWFVNFRFPGHENIKVVDGVPEGWAETYVPDIIQVNPKLKVEMGKEIWYVPMASLSTSGMTADTSKFELRTRHTNVKFKRNDILFARITPCLENGKTGLAYFLEKNEIACGSTEFIVLRGNRVSPYFTYCLARSYDFRENAIKSMTGSSGRQRVQVECLNEYPVPLPPKLLLNQFDEMTKKCFAQIQILMKQNQKLAEARDLLLPRLMTGEVEV